MDFGFDARTEELRARLLAFMDAHVYPAEATDAAQVDKEMREALHPFTRQDGTVWMPNVFRYVVARRD